jgi:hypothetical protein
MSNNIAEGSGSGSKREFSNFLNIARRSTFENANVVLVLENQGLLGEAEVAGDTRPPRSFVSQDHEFPAEPPRLALALKISPVSA